MRLCGYGLVACLLMGTPMAVGKQLPERANLVPNPGFEDVDAAGVLRGWKLPKPVFSVSEEAPRTGSKCLKYHNEDPARYQLAAIPLELKTGQRYEFSVWVKTANLAGKDSGATVCIEWHDADGKYLGGSYPRGIKGTHATWTEVKGVTVRVPDRAAGCSLTCYVRKGMTGTAWFDDVMVREYYPPLVDAITADAYRGVYAGGKAGISVGLSLDEQRLRPEDITISLVLQDETGVPVARGKLEKIKIDEADFSVNMQPLAVGEYTALVKAETRGGGRSATTEVRLHRVVSLPKRAVAIDRYGRTLVDGVPFFPLGTYWGDIKEKHLALYAQSAFNCLMPYGRPHADQMDLVQKYGLKVIYSLKDYYAGTKFCPHSIKTPDDERPAIEEAVKRFRGHPALLAWYLNDELPPSMVDRLSRHQRWLEELDPDHPTWVVLYQVRDLRRYLSTFDILGTDPYPLPNHPIRRALDWTRMTRSAVFGKRAIWQVPQIFDYAAYRKGKEREACRAPTLLEMRSMAWQCIAAGANGLIFYSWFDLWRSTVHDPFEKRWPQIKAMAAEIAAHQDILLSLPAAPAPEVSSDESVGRRAWKYRGSTCVLLVNSGPEPRSARITLDDGVQATKVFGNGSIGSKAGACVVTLPPFEPVMVRLQGR